MARFFSAIRNTQGHLKPLGHACVGSISGAQEIGVLRCAAYFLTNASPIEGDTLVVAIEGLNQIVCTFNTTFCSWEY